MADAHLELARIVTQGDPMNYALLAALAVYGSALWVAGFLYGRMWELHNPTPTWHRRSPNGRAR